MLSLIPALPSMTIDTLNIPAHPVDGTYIKEWLVVGPFPGEDLETDFLAEVGGEPRARPQAGDTVAGKDNRLLTWQRYASRDSIINLLDAIGLHTNVTGYAVCFLVSQVAGTTQIYLGSDDGAAVWINGQHVHSNPIDRELTFDEDVFAVELNAGTNFCLVKVSQRRANWCFALRAVMLPPNHTVLSGAVTDEAGLPIPSATVRLEENGSAILKTHVDGLGRYRVGNPSGAWSL